MVLLLLQDGDCVPIIGASNELIMPNSMILCTAIVRLPNLSLSLSHGGHCDDNNIDSDEIDNKHLEE